MATPDLLRPCPVCGENGAREILRKEPLRLVQCPACAMVYANPVAAEFVSGAFYDARGTAFYLSPDKVQGDYAPVRFARELALLRRFCPRGKILDVGCSNGAFLFQAQRRFPGAYETLGVDVAGAPLEHAREKGVPVRQGSFLKMDFGGAPFSAVTFWATLEHLIDPASHLAKAAAVLEADGCCFILVPNFTSLAVRLLGAKYRYILPQHVNYFTAATLRKLAARQADWRVVYSASTHFNPAVLWQDWRKRGPVTDADRARLLRRTTACKQNPALGPFKFGLTLVERALGAKFLADNVVLVLRRRGPHSDLATGGQR